MLFFSILVARSIAHPILDVINVAQEIEAGGYQARSAVRRDDEVGALSRSINRMGEAIQSQIEVLKGAGAISECAIGHRQIAEFGSALLKTAMEQTGAQVGAFYILNEHERAFEPAASVGLEASALTPFDPNGYEGELGRALLTKKISIVRDIPPQSVHSLRLVAGVAAPREVITIPLQVRDETRGFVSLGALHPFSQDAVRVIEQSHIAMSTAFAGLLATFKTEQLAEEIRTNNEELKVSNEELQAQAEELKAQAEELREQALELDTQKRQVEEADRLKSEFLSNMSHELRTPLNSIMALSQLMISRGAGKNPEQEAQYLEVIERNGRQLLDLINDILDLSKIEAGRMDVAISEFNLKQCIGRVVETIEPIAKRKELSLLVEAPEYLMLKTDEDKVAQILLNLLANAVKFTENGGITVRCEAQGDLAVITIRDTGIGIPSDQIACIFDEFRQVDGSTTRRYEGTGLGLAIGRRLAEMLGGRISVESIEGQGSVFTLSLPRRFKQGAVGLLAHPPVSAAYSAAQQAEAARVESIAEMAPARAGGPLALVVEDNEIAALQIRSTLEDKGLAVMVADGGSMAMSIIRELMPDIVILDLMMPVFDGFQVVEEMQKDPQTASIPVLVLTAKELTAVDRERLNLRNVRRLVKKGSVDREQLGALVDRLLGESPKRSSPAAASTTAPRRAVAGGTVLVVEDNADNRFTIAAILEQMGCKYVTAEDGAQAVETAKREKPALILMDIQLPVMSGLDAMAKIKADPELHETPVVALTARAMKGDREKIMDAGFDGYLAKPLDTALLRKTVHEWIE